jgi:hypothetical protein
MMLRRVSLLTLAAALAVVATLSGTAAPPAAAATTVTITNFTPAGEPVTMFDTNGNAIDAHEGGIELFDGTYYLYGEYHDCAVMWGIAGTPWCGVRIYSSNDLVGWVDRGLAFDPTGSDGIGTRTWQDDCEGDNAEGSYGCYRPHVAYNASTGKYVMWINGHGQNFYSYWILTSNSPAGPFTLVSATPQLNKTGHFLGDHDLFVDTNGTGYLAYTDWTLNAQVVEKLNASFTSGTGIASDTVVLTSQQNSEAPSLFKRDSLYYMVLSDPNCGYCHNNGGASYRSAPSPLGPWSARTVISAAGVPVASGGSACGGQPALVTPVPLANGTTSYLMQIDLNMPQVYNQGPGTWFWEPLVFNAAGSIAPLTCTRQFSLDLATAAPVSDEIPQQDQSSGRDGFVNRCDVNSSNWRMQTFTPAVTGTLSAVAVTTYQRYVAQLTGPNAPLKVDVVALDASANPVQVLSSSSLQPSPLTAITPAAGAVSWAPKRIAVQPGIQVTAGTTYGIRLGTTSTTGCYGVARNDSGAAYSRGVSRVSTNGGQTWTTEASADLKFVTAVTPTAGGNALTVTGDFAFGSVPVGSASATRTVTLTNNTGSTVSFTGTSGRSGPVFNMVTTSDMCNWGSVLAPGQSCTAALRANPSVTGLTTSEFVATFQNGVPDVVVPESVTGT